MGRVRTSANQIQIFRILAVLATTTLWVNFNYLDAHENWSRFHGPNGGGLAEEAEIPGKITNQDYLWKVKLAGVGSSSPVVWDDLLYVTSCDTETGK